MLAHEALQPLACQAASRKPASEWRKFFDLSLPPSWQQNLLRCKLEAVAIVLYLKTDVSLVSLSDRTYDTLSSGLFLVWLLLSAVGTMSLFRKYIKNTGCRNLSLPDEVITSLLMLAGLALSEGNALFFACKLAYIVCVLCVQYSEKSEERYECAESFLAVCYLHPFCVRKQILLVWLHVFFQHGNCIPGKVSQYQMWGGERFGKQRMDVNCVRDWKYCKHGLYRTHCWT